MSQTRDPNSTYCRRCGAELVWEHPKGSGHYQMSSDYVGGDICRSCLEEQRSMPTGAAEVMDEDVTKIPVTLYQAPFAVLSERGLLLKMHDHNRPYAGPVPSQYYMPVFHGNLEFRGPLPQDPIARRASILETSSPYITVMTVRTPRPAAACRLGMWLNWTVSFISAPPRASLRLTSNRWN